MNQNPQNSGRYLFNTIVVTVVLVAVAFVLSLSTPPPLEQLEQRTRQMPVLYTLYAVPTDDDFAQQAVILQRVVENVLGVKVNYLIIPDPELFGWTQLNSKGPRMVNISKALHGTARLEVLAHEAAHRLEPPVLPPDSDSEVFAEAVSYLVCRAYGHDSLEATAQYLAMHKGGLHILTDYRIEIDYAVFVLSGGASKDGL